MSDQLIERIVLWPMLAILVIMVWAIVELLLGKSEVALPNKLIQSTILKLQGVMILFGLWWLSLVLLGHSSFYTQQRIYVSLRNTKRRNFRRIKRPRN